MTLSQLHGALANSVLLFSLILGVYGLLIYARKQNITSNFWGTLVIAELLYVAQALVGVALVLQQLRPARGVHFLYGILSIITLPSAYAYLRGRDDRQAALVFGLIGLFMAGVALRAMSTATQPAPGGGLHLLRMAAAAFWGSGGS
ncbi:MAG: hypothetical protein HY784_00560 [Chloroflexi bacterium]|nr:hypothetical protein [Chloroflexota bacterium]